MQNRNSLWVRLIASQAFILLGLMAPEVFTAPFATSVHAAASTACDVCGGVERPGCDESGSTVEPGDTELECCGDEEEGEWYNPNDPTSDCCD